MLKSYMTHLVWKGFLWETGKIHKKICKKVLLELYMNSGGARGAQGAGAPFYPCQTSFFCKTSSLELRNFVTSGQCLATISLMHGSLVGSSNPHWLPGPHCRSVSPD